MNKHTDLKIIAHMFKAIGVLAFLIGLWYMALTESIFFMVYGVVGFVWWYAIGGVLLIFIDIAKSVRASAVVAIEQEDRRKEKPKPVVNKKSLGLARIGEKKRMKA